ncbi:MAG: ornithine--oxo-acid transaminase [Bdellovibrionota bacterium]
MLTQDEHLKIIGKYSARNYAPLPVVISQAEGAWVTDINGKRYLDMLSAYSAVSHGHRHPALVWALMEQASRVCLTSRAFHNDQFALFCKELAEYCGYEIVLPMNTGAEAVETAIKAVRRWGYRKKRVPSDKAEIIACSNNFHGRTVSIISFSTEKAYRDDFGPFTPGFKVIPFGDIGSLREAITPNTVGFLVEPIQGEGGIIIPPEGYFRAAAELCRENNVLLMLDEIQTGLGRTGKKFGFEHEGIRPDMLVLGKALGGGIIPVSAVLASSEILGVFEPGSHGSTFGGNPLACAVGRAALITLEKERLPEKARELGDHLVAELKKIKSSKIREVRGRGLLVGIELNSQAGGARPYCERLMHKGVLCKETHENVIRIAPPLVISREDLDWAIEKFKGELV